MAPGTVKRSIASNTYVPNAHLCNKAQFLLQAITTFLKTLVVLRLRFNTWLITWGNALRFTRHHIKFLWLQSGFVTKVWGSLWSNQEGFQICYNKKARRLYLSLKCHRLILQNQNDKRNTIGKLILRSWSLYKQTKKYFLLKFYYSFSTLYSLLQLRRDSAVRFKINLPDSMKI